MKFLLLLILLVTPLREIEDVKLAIPPIREQIFLDYANDNFSQEFKYGGAGQGFQANIRNKNFAHLNLRFRIFLDRQFLKTLDAHTRDTVVKLFGSCYSFSQYFENISTYLRDQLTYTDSPLPQDVESVLKSGKAHCVGYANLTRLFLNAAGIENKFVKGFYLKKSAKKTISPVPHKWLEIRLANGTRFFYDPQRQLFSANYMVVEDQIDFKKIRRFKIKLITRSKKILN